VHDNGPLVSIQVWEFSCFSEPPLVAKFCFLESVYFDIFPKDIYGKQKLVY
jgi:hypothetical protein